VADARYKLLLAIALTVYNGNNRSTAIMQGSWRTTPAWTESPANCKHRSTTGCPNSTLKA
jgi:hypothetical protein